jgi:hypothetical protein
MSPHNQEREKRNEVIEQRMRECRVTTPRVVPIPLNAFSLMTQELSHRKLPRLPDSAMPCALLEIQENLASLIAFFQFFQLDAFFAQKCSVSR